MLGFEEVTYTFATITCSWPECDNRINMRPGPGDLDRELRDLNALRGLAVSYGWSFINDGHVTQCPYHTRKEVE